MKELDEKNCLFKKICEQLELYINIEKLSDEKYWNAKRVDAKKIKKETLLSDLYFESDEHFYFYFMSDGRDFFDDPVGLEFYNSHLGCIDKIEISDCSPDDTVQSLHDKINSRLSDNAKEYLDCVNACAKRNQIMKAKPYLKDYHGNDEVIYLVGNGRHVRSRNFKYIESLMPRHAFECGCRTYHVKENFANDNWLQIEAWYDQLPHYRSDYTNLQDLICVLKKIEEFNDFSYSELEQIAKDFL